MKRTCQCGNSCNFKQTVYGNENTETWVQDTVPFLLPVIANTEKRKTFSRLFSFPWKLNHLCSPQVITYTPICTHMFSYTDRLSDLSPCKAIITAVYLHCTFQRLLVSQSIRPPYIHDVWLFMLVSPADILNHWCSIFQNFTSARQNLTRAVFCLG